MEHFYQNIQGWFDYEDLYRQMASMCYVNSTIVEVGSWKGKSAAFMAVEILNRNPSIRFHCVDTWLGSVEHQEGGPFADEHAINGTLYEHFLENIKPVKHVINPIRMDSISASKLFTDRTLEFVFIDADHSYEGVSADIKAWKPKLIPGGFLCGHDINWSQDVVRAVSENVPEYQIRGSCWFYQIPRV